MAWRGEHRRFCKGCGRERKDDELFSARGLCSKCGMQRAALNTIQISLRKGPMYDHWRRQQVVKLGGVLVDDLQDAE